MLWITREQVLAGRRSTAWYQLDALAHSRDAATRLRVAKNPSAQSDALWVLSRDEDPEVREQVARRADVPRKLLAKLSEDPSSADYEAAVEAAKVAIRDGEVFQVVPSQTFEVDCAADALDVYRALRATNPSPYMYLFRFADPDGGRFDVVGSSPESLVKVSGGRAMTHPIAGTRPRGATPELDTELAADLLADAKERAEHLMLVDLARNDLARVCRPGTVEVVEFMEVWRYSHVMHLVSTVTGEVREGRTAFDVLQSTFPAGTLSGAPKPRALALIDELEPVRRGLYGGTAGYFDVAGDLDMAITIRSAVLRDGVARVQAGAGVVADSVPASEEAETRAKAAAVLAAVARAGALRPLPGA